LGKSFLQHRSDLFPRMTTAVDDAVSFFKFGDLVLIKAETPQSDQIETYHLGAFSVDRNVRQYILGNSCHASDHTQFSYAAELVNGSSSTKVGTVFDDDMSSQHDVVHQDRMISHVTVVSDMSAYHDQAVVADRGFVGRVQSTVNRCEFANSVFPAENQMPVVFPGLDMLWDTSQYGGVPNVVVCSQDRTTLYDDVAAKLAPVPQYYILFDNTKRPNGHRGADFGLRVNACQRVNV
jgi:hypothetical protein